MNNTGFTVYLKVSIEELANRLYVNKNNRPLLRDKTPHEMLTYIAENLEKRESYYNQAKLIFDAEQMFADMDVDHIIDNLMLYLPQNK